MSQQNYYSIPECHVETCLQAGLVGIIYELPLQAHDETITNLRADFERQAREIEQKYERKMRALREELDLRRKTEIHEIEERKNSQINTLMKNHEKAFSDIKNYYNDITLNNLALINTLKVSKFLVSSVTQLIFESLY